ncbi:MAG: type II toxin-antitoxin system RelE/ParE family toxin [Burkholderiaceae bacterium]|jgi:proteic killer suppression protein|nr:type II toxin-antitoxin system RelE/ParE family toxin [Burkholderiaceae bacterium]
MIVHFHHQGVEALFRMGQVHGIPAGHARKLGIVLSMLDVAQSPQELSQPALRLQPVKGAQPNLWSVWVNDNWRLIFRFVGVDIDIVDYRDGT